MQTLVIAAIIAAVASVGVALISVIMAKASHRSSERLKELETSSAERLKALEVASAERLKTLEAYLSLRAESHAVLRTFLTECEKMRICCRQMPALLTEQVDVRPQLGERALSLANAWASAKGELPIQHLNRMRDSWHQVYNCVAVHGGLVELASRRPDYLKKVESHTEVVLRVINAFAVEIINIKDDLIPNTSRETHVSSSVANETKASEFTDAMPPD